MATHREELKALGTTTAAIHLPIGKPLPVDLISLLVKGRIEENKIRKRRGGGIP